MEPKVMDIIQYAFYGLVSLIATYGVSVLASLKKSIDLLNTQVAMVIEKTAWHEKALDKHDDRISELEKYK